MTLDSERIDYLNYTREFLRSLLDPKKTPKVPRKIRQAALCCLRHYPEEYWVDRLNKVSKLK